ncbi:MAG: hypothetical protein QW414_05930, partial [Candidatus Bathyarchaeia archaeon]
MDRFDVALKMMASIIVIYMLISILYLYIAVGENWGLVLSALLESRVHGAIFISISSAILVGILAVAAAIPVAYVLTYANFRGK